MYNQKFLVGDSWMEGGDDCVPVINPATGETIGSVHHGGADVATAACAAADVAQKLWAAQAPRERSEVLRRCYELISTDAELAPLISLEHGKPLDDAVGEVAYAAEFFRWNAEEAVRISGSLSLAPSGSNQIIVRHPPVGVVVVVTPWNFPAAMITRKVAPALAAGNAVVIKPAPETPLTALRLGKLFLEAGVPPGVVNIVPTTDAAGWFDAAVEHRATRMVSFTGSTGVGKLLLKRSADRVLKVGMELGGNAPFIVHDDADIDAAVEGAMVAKMRHSAETCTAANRFFVHASVEERFLESFGAAMGDIVAGPATDPLSTCGPLITDVAQSRVDELVQNSVDRGAKVVTGGSRIGGDGYFFEPTVIAGIEADDPITSDEIFGPVAPVISFESTDEVIEMANATEAGLAGYVYSSNLATAFATAEALDVGMVGVNRGGMSDPAAPFGGSKQSGLGREGGAEGIYEFCETQYIAATW